MDGDTPHALSPAEAKARLRAAAEQVSATKWLSGRRWTVLAVALAGGFIVGRVPSPMPGRALLLRRFAPLLLAALWRKRKEKSKVGE